MNCDQVRYRNVEPASRRPTANPNRRSAPDVSLDARTWHCRAGTTGNSGQFRQGTMVWVLFGDGRRGYSSPESMSVTRDMSGFGSTRSVRFSPEGSHAAGGQNGPDHGCDWVASSEEAELRGGSGTIGHERAALSPAARRL